MSMTYQILDCHKPWMEFIDWVEAVHPGLSMRRLEALREELASLAKFVDESTCDEFEAEHARTIATESLKAFWVELHPSIRPGVQSHYFELTGFAPDHKPFDHIEPYRAENVFVAARAKEGGCENIFRFFDALSSNVDFSDQFAQLLSHNRRLSDVTVATMALVLHHVEEEENHRQNHEISARRAARILELYLASSPTFVRWWATITA